MMAARTRQVPPARAAGWTDPAFARVADIIHAVAGLVFPPNRQPSAEAGMRRAMSTLRITDIDALGRAMKAPGEAREAVLAELTVGETYFFREAAQLDMLRTDILPSLLATRGPDTPLRIWSAGCASGEEPYSLAIMLQEFGWPRAARILGTDVARPRLEGARRGRYSKWSLRGVSQSRIDRWFERRASHFQLDPGIREAVQFSALNLIADDYPSAATGTLEQDIVLCRNALIYFDMASVAQIATRLLASLAPDGWLLLGASDPPLSGLVPCEVVMTTGGVMYRRADRDPARSTPATTSAAALRWPGPPSSPPWISPSVPVEAAPLRAATVPPTVPASVAASAGVAHHAAVDHTRTEALARESLERDASRHAEWAVLIRSLANQGRLREADEACVRALDLHRLSPELHCLHAILLTAAEQYREAANAARRALYLDRRFVMAHLQLGEALARLGDTARAARAFESVVRALALVTDDEPVPAADGVVASRLRHIAEARLNGMHTTRRA